MKRNIILLLSIIFVAFAFSCKNHSKDSLDSSLVNIPKSDKGSNPEDLPVITFETETHNFENIFEGEVVSHTFKFKNTGNSDLIISDAKASCGCTVPEFPKLPIKPGESSYVTVKFDSKGKQGVQNKTITVLANTIPNAKVLTITGVVVGSK